MKQLTMFSNEWGSSLDILTIEIDVEVTGTRVTLIIIFARDSRHEVFTQQ